MKSTLILVEDYPKLKRAYTKAMKFGLLQFEFKEKTLTTIYAKYVLEYLKPLYSKSR